MDIDADVVVVGAGPAGLMLAGELRLGGADVIVLERLARPSGQSRGLGFTTRTVEVFDQRGLLPMFGDVQVSPRGHFGGMQFDYSILEDSNFGARGITQGRTEAVLETWATGLGADLRRAWEFHGVTELDDGVEITADTPDGPTRVRARYLVGADGGHSTVRAVAGFDFPGSPATRLMYLADVVGARIPPRFLGARLAGGMVMAAPLTDDTDRIIIVEDGSKAESRTESIDFAELADIWERLTGEDIHGARATWIGSFTDRTRQVTQYRRGRVLLVGDAAHVHLPAGGQGLSTGVQDAVNLGWKLAAEIQGWAPPGLLDSYHCERYAVGERLLMNTRAQGMLFVGGPEMDPLRSLFGELIQYDDVRRHLSGIVSGLDIRYDVGTGEHPLLGRRLPPRGLADAWAPGEAPAARTTTELLRPGRGLLIDVAGDVDARATAAGWSDRVTVVSAKPGSAAPFDSPVTLLVRPDGYVVWAGPGADLSAALERWFGSPAHLEVPTHRGREA